MRKSSPNPKPARTNNRLTTTAGAFPLFALKPQSYPVILLSALPDVASAEELADALVGAHLAACVNIFPEMRSVYFWQGEILREKEVKVFVKTSSEVAAAAVTFIKARHPYSAPEITTIGKNGDVDMHPDYWAWLTAYVGSADATK